MIKLNLFAQYIWLVFCFTLQDCDAKEYVGFVEVVGRWDLGIAGAMEEG